MESSFYRDMAETSVDGLWVFDLEGLTRYANPAVAAMFGVPLEEFMDLTAFDILDEGGKADLARHLDDVRAGRSNTESVEVYFVRRDGSALWTLVSEQVLRDADGAVSGVLQRFSDNDERRRRVDELAQSRRELAEAHAIARLGSFTLDVGSQLMLTSESMCEIYGLDPSAPVPVSTWLDAVHEEDRSRVQAALETTLRDGSDFDILVRVAGPDGWIWTRGRGAPRRDDEGRIIGLSGTHQDVTAHKRVEEALEQQIARHALVQAVATACNEARTLDEAVGEVRRMIRERDEWAEVRAYLPDEDGLEVHPMLAEVYDDHGAADHALAVEALRTGEASWDASGTILAFPLCFRGRVHAVFALTAVATPEDPAEALARVREATTLLTRVVEREYADQELSAARDEAIGASRAKSEFLAVMSHEIRTPLNGVIGLNDLMLKTSLERGQRQLARGIRDAGRSLLRLVNDVLDLSKIEAGQLALEIVDFEVRDVCDQVVELMGDAARRKGVELALACDPDVPEVLAGDPTRLGQVLTNLISNAVEFTADGHVLVRVTSRCAGRRVRLSVDVADTGEGIAPEAMGRVFDDFSQADRSTTRVHGGTGLGLAISRHIVHALEGELTVTSVLGEGSTFTFTAVLEVARGSRTSPDDDLARTRLRGSRVLVVSDQDARTGLLRDQLTLWRTRVDHAVDEDAAGFAVERARAEGDPYEAVVVDVPAARPQEVARTAALLAVARDPQAFLVLTQRPEAAVVWAVREPSVQVLTKPLTSAALRDALIGVDEDEAPASATSAALVRTDHPRVLVVEDNAVNQMVANGMLESLGYDVEVAEDGVEAVERFDPARHAAVLMDVQMPRMDGYAATRALREKHADGPHFPILAMTAAAIDGERERCLAAGMDDFLTKPVEMDTIGAVLARWIRPDAAAPGEPPADPTAPAPAQARMPAELQISADFHVTPVPTPRDDPAEATAREPVSEEVAVDDARAVLDSSRLDALLEMGPQAEAYLARAVDNFLTGHPRLMADVRSTVADSDPDGVSFAAHKLAGSALNLGLTEVGIAARAVELAQPPDCPPATYGPLVTSLEGAIQRAVPALEAYWGSRGDHCSSA